MRPARRPPIGLRALFGLLGLATLLVGLTIWTWRGLLIASLTMLAISVAVEIAQGAYSSTRVVEPNDAVANTAGVALGVLVAALTYLSWSTIAALARPVRGR